MKRLLTASVLVVGTVYSAYAADLRPAYKSPPPAPPPPPSFTGCYLYGGGGYWLFEIHYNFKNGNFWIAEHGPNNVGRSRLARWRRRRLRLSVRPRLRLLEQLGRRRVCRCRLDEH